MAWLNVRTQRRQAPKQKWLRPEGSKELFTNDLPATPYGPNSAPGDFMRQFAAAGGDVGRYGAAAALSAGAMNQDAGGGLEYGQIIERLRQQDANNNPTGWRQTPIDLFSGPGDGKTQAAYTRPGTVGGAPADGITSASGAIAPAGSTIPRTPTPITPPTGDIRPPAPPPPAPPPVTSVPGAAPPGGPGGKPTDGTVPPLPPGGRTAFSPITANRSFDPTQMLLALRQATNYGATPGPNSVQGNLASWLAGAMQNRGS